MSTLLDGSLAGSPGAGHLVGGPCGGLDMDFPRRAAALNMQREKQRWPVHLEAAACSTELD